MKEYKELIDRVMLVCKIVDDFDKKVPLIEIANLLEEYKNGSKCSW